jgi:hypothetical protein
MLKALDDRTLAKPYGAASSPIIQIPGREVEQMPSGTARSLRVACSL